MPPSKEAVEAARWDVSMAEYHADATSFSNSTLKIARASLKKYEWVYLLNRIPNKSSRALDFGTACHLKILEPDLFEKHFAIRPTHYNGPDGPEKIGWKKPKNDHKSYVEKWHVNNIGKEHLKPKEIDYLNWMIEAAREHDVANELLFQDKGECEYSVKVKEPSTGMMVKSRYDKVIFKKDTIVNLKTAKTAEFNLFRKQMEELDYDTSAALACYSYQELFGIFPVHIFVVIENQPPFEVETYDLGRDSLDLAQQFNINTLNRIKAMQAVSTPQQSGYRSRTHGTLVHMESSKWRRKELLR